MRLYQPTSTEFQFNESKFLFNIDFRLSFHMRNVLDEKILVIYFIFWRLYNFFNRKFVLANVERPRRGVIHLQLSSRVEDSNSMLNAKLDPIPNRRKNTQKLAFEQKTIKNYNIKN